MESHRHENGLDLGILPQWLDWHVGDFKLYFWSVFGDTQLWESTYIVRCEDSGHMPSVKGLGKDQTVDKFSKSLQYVFLLNIFIQYTYNINKLRAW